MAADAEGNLPTPADLEKGDPSTADAPRAPPAADEGGSVVRAVVDRWRREDLLDRGGLVLRALILLFSLLASIITASNKHGDWKDFDHYQEYKYLLGVSILALLYSVAQVWRQAHRFSTRRDLVPRNYAGIVDFAGDQIWVEHMEMHTRFLYLNRQVKVIDQQMQALKAQDANRARELAEAKAAATKSGEEAAQYRVELLKAQEKAETLEQETASARAKDQEELRQTRDQLIQRGKELSRALEESVTWKKRAEDFATEKKTLEDEFAAYKEGEPERVKAAQEAWLASQEYFDQYQEKTARMLEYCYDRALKQVYEAGLFPEGTSLEFLDINKVWSALSEEDRRGH